MSAGRGIAAVLLLLAGCARPAPPAVVLPIGPGAAPLSAPTPFRWSGEATQGGLIAGTLPTGTVALAIDGRPVAYSGMRFIVGLDRDAPTVAMLTATLADGRAVIERIAVAPRAWPISRLSSLAKYPVPTAEFTVRRPAELAAIEAARRTATDATGWQQRFLWPTTGRISTRFGAQRIYANDEAGAYHSGIDIARPMGTPVKAPADGVVVLAAQQSFTLEGKLLMIDHGLGLGSAFLHLSRIDVAVGDHVRQGQLVGAVGMTGRATGPHLHWSIRWNDARLDPLLVAGAMPTS